MFGFNRKKRHEEESAEEPELKEETTECEECGIGLSKQEIKEKRCWTCEFDGMSLSDALFLSREDFVRYLIYRDGYDDGDTMIAKINLWNLKNIDTAEQVSLPRMSKI